MLSKNDCLISDLVDSKKCRNCVLCRGGAGTVGINNQTTSYLDILERLLPSIHVSRRGQGVTVSGADYASQDTILLGNKGCLEHVKFNVSMLVQTKRSRSH